MTEPKRLTPEELAEVRLNHDENTTVSMQWDRAKLIRHIAALEAELARIDAITMGLTPDPEPTEGVEAKVWEMVKSRHLTTSASHHCPSCGGWHEYVKVCPNNGREIDWGAQ